jgi:hypothetical protein
VSDLTSGFMALTRASTPPACLVVKCAVLAHVEVRWRKEDPYMWSVTPRAVLHTRYVLGALVLSSVQRRPAGRRRRAPQYFDFT